MTEKKFVKQTIIVTILSEGEVPDWCTLSDIDYLITDGGAAGNVTIEDEKEISEEEIKKLLVEFGSEPGFFGLDQEENKVYIISDGNAIEKTDDWEEVIRIAETWYEYISDHPESYWEGNPDDIPENPDYSDIPEGDVEELVWQIGVFEEKLARLQNIHNSYNLRIEEEESE